MIHPKNDASVKLIHELFHSIIIRKLTMQSHGETLRKYGHSRRPSYSKAMPVSALLMNYTSPQDRFNDSIAKDGMSPEHERPPMVFTLSEVNSDHPDTKVECQNFIENEQIDCSVSADNEFVFVSLKDALPSNDDIETCPMTELCNLLCDNSCKKIEQKSTDNGSVNEMKTKARANDRNKFLSSMLADNNVASVVDKESMANEQMFNGEKIIDDSIYKLKINEALVRTSMLTSPAARRRLAARKIEMEIDAASINAEDGEYVPPRSLLMFLVRMGSFNSAPKINNADTQDDLVDIPVGLTSSDLVHHCMRMRGDNRPPLLTRNFLKPIGNDLTDGVRVLQLNSVSKICSAPVSSPNHIRILQWNILSQSLGQNNDGFVRCPDEALTWECRKYLIIQEIVQNDPDIVCLQEVDHFKFLQSVLATQQYEGIFYPKPDSPCLYISENNGPDGCAIFFKKNKFELVNYDTRILEVWRVQSNQVAIAVNLKVLETGKEFSVCTTHLKARNGALLSKLRNEQGKDLLKFTQQVADARPVIMCGDFNAEPREPVYKTILQYESLGLSSAYADLIAALGVRLPKPVQDESHDEVDAIDNHEPPFTTWKIREDGEVCHTIDYVFYSQDKLKVNNCLMFPQDNEIGRDRTPSFRYPSDHFSLVCDFEFTDDDATETSH